MKRFIVMIVAVLVVCAIWMAGWFYVSGEIRSEIAYLAEADGITQPRLTCETLNVGGAPFSFSPRCDGAEITVEDTTISLANITGTALFYRPFHIQAFATGPARVTDAFTGAAQEIDWSNLHASLRIENGAIERVSALADDIVYTDTLFGQTEIGSAGRGEIHLLDTTPSDRQPGTGMLYDFYLTLEGVMSEPYDIANGDLVIDGRLSGVPDASLWSTPELLAYWQAYDGQIELRALNADADGLTLTAKGEARLNDLGQINGQVAITSEGIAGRIADLVGDPAMARMMLGNPDENGISRQTLTITNGNVVVGILPMANLPPLF